jgi:hypothetical protein
MGLGEELGADAGISVQCLTLYIPDRDQEGNEIGDQRRWVLEAAKLLASIGGGVTIMPPVEGGWMNQKGEIIWEKPVLLYTFVEPRLFRKAIPALRRFLHALGRDTKQGEVAFEFDSRFYRIGTFDTGRK